MFVHHQLGLAVHPHDPPVPGQEPEFGAKTLTGKTGAREALGPAHLVVRMQLPIPEEGVFQPFLSGKAEQLLDLRTDIQFAGAPVQGCHERHRGNLLHQSPVLGLRPVQLRLPAATCRALPRSQEADQLKEVAAASWKRSSHSREMLLCLLMRRSFSRRRFAPTMVPRPSPA